MPECWFHDYMDYSAWVMITKRKLHFYIYHNSQPEKYKLVDSFYVCMLLFGTTPENFRAKSASCFWVKLLQPLNFQFWETDFELKIRKIHIKCSIFSHRKNHSELTECCVSVSLANFSKPKFYITFHGIKKHIIVLKWVKEDKNPSVKYRNFT